MNINAISFAEDWGDWGTRADRQAYRLILKIVREFVTDAGAAQEFKSKNAPEIALLPAAMRKNLDEYLDRIGA